jgi:hypothetical protein
MAHPVTPVPPSFYLWMSIIVEIRDLGKLGSNLRPFQKKKKKKGSNLRHMVEKRLNSDFQFIKYDS